MIKTFVCDRCGAETEKDYTTSIWCSWIAGTEKIPPRYDLCRNCAYGIRTIYGMTGAQSIPVLQKAIKALESMKEDIVDKRRRECEEQGATGYWMPTRENAIKPLYQLLAFAEMRPDGIWEGD